MILSSRQYRLVLLSIFFLTGCRTREPVGPDDAGGDPLNHYAYAMTGRVFGVHGSDTVWISGAEIALDTNHVATSGIDGAFQFDSLDAGSHVITVDAAGYAHYLEILRLVSDTVRLIRLSGLFGLSGTIFGILDGDTIRADSAGIRLDGSWSAWTDPWGRFTLSDIPQGDHDLTIQHHLFEPSIQKVHMDSSTTEAFNISLSSEAMDHFPLSVGLRFVYDYSYDFQDRGTAIRPGTGTIDSGTVTYEILDRSDISAEVREWTVSESRRLFRRELKNTYGGDSLYDAVTPYWIDSTVTITLRETLDGGHRLSGEALVWMLPFYDMNKVWSGEDASVVRYGLGSSIRNTRTINYMTDVMEFQGGSGLVRRSVEEHGSCMTCGDLSVLAVLIEGP